MHSIFIIYMYVFNSMQILSFKTSTCISIDAVVKKCMIIATFDIYLIFIRSCPENLLKMH